MSTHNILFLNLKKIIQFIPNLQLWDLFQVSQERVRSNRGKRAISVRAIEVLLYFVQSQIDLIKQSCLSSSPWLLSFFKHVVANFLFTLLLVYLSLILVYLQSKRSTYIKDTKTILYRNIRDYT